MIDEKQVFWLILLFLHPTRTGDKTFRIKMGIRFHSTPLF